MGDTDLDCVEIASGKLAFKIGEDNQLGRYLEATRDIEVGEIVLEERPLVIGPSQVTEPVCLGCLKGLRSGDCEECSRCGWPVCNQTCAARRSHRAECEWTTKKRKQKVKITNFGSPHPNYECITPLRCLDKRETDPKTWRILSALESHCEDRKAMHKDDSDKRSVAGFLHRFFKADADYNEEEILRICGIIQINGHENPLTFPPSVAIYNQASLLEHSCHPNCGKSFAEGDVLVIRAAKKIKAGDHISICYTDSLWGTLNRRHHLLESKFFLCQCPRCVDPTELGTFYSALSCPNKECDSFVVPAADESDSGAPPSEWTCGKCGSSRSADNVQSVVGRIMTDLNAMDKNDEASCKLFLDHYGGQNLLHPNHFLLTEVRLALAQLYGQKSSQGIQDLSDEELQHKTDLCKQVLKLARHLFVADWRIQGTLLFELHAAIAERSRRDSASGLLDPTALMNRLMESKFYLEEAYKLLKHEPEALPEGKIAIQCEINLSQLETLLQKIHHTVGDCPI